MKSYIRILSAVFVLVFAFCAVGMCSVSAEGDYTQPEKFIYGDVNQDLEVNVKDVTYIQKGLANLTYVTAVQRFLADPEGEGYSIKNATAIQKFLAKYEVSSLLGTELPMTSQDEFSSQIKISNPNKKNRLGIIPKDTTHSYCSEDFPELDVYKVNKITHFDGDIEYEVFLYSDTEAELFEAVKNIDYRANIDLLVVEFWLTTATLDEA